MARASSVDSTWVGALASGVSIGGSTLTLADVTGTNWPSGSGVFGVQVGEDPDDDAELCQVTRSGTTLTLDASTLTKDHDAGAPIYYLTTAADINAKSDTGHTHAQSDITNLTTDLAAKYGSGSTILAANGSASAPSHSFASNTGTGWYRQGANAMSAATAATERVRITSVGAAIFYGALVANASFNMAATDIGSSLNINASTTPGLLRITDASCVLNLSQRTSWTNIPLIYIIEDPLGVLTDLTVNPWNDGGIFSFNDINGADGTYGVWDDGGGGGPGGTTAVLTDAGATWLLVGATNDTGSGAIGGWTLRKIATDLSY